MRVLGRSPYGSLEEELSFLAILSRERGLEKIMGHFGFHAGSSSVSCGGLAIAEILILSLTPAEVSLGLGFRGFPQGLLERNCHL